MMKESPPSLFALLHQQSHFFGDMNDDDDTPKCLIVKGCKVKSQSKLLDSDSDSDCESIRKGVSKNAMSKIKELMETIV